MVLARAGLGGAFVLFACSVASCSLVVSLDGLSDGGADAGGDAGDASDATADTSSIVDAAPDTSSSADASDASQGSVPPAFRAFSSANNGGSGPANISVARSPQIQAGDLMIAFVYEFSFGTVSTAPAGWSKGQGFDDQGPSYEVFTYYKYAGAAEPSSYDFATSTSLYGEVDLITYSGVDDAVPFDAVQTTTFENQTNYVLPQVTPSELNDTIFYGAVADGQASASWSAPAAVTTRKTSGYTFFGDAPQPIKTETDPRTLLCSVQSNGGVIVLAIRPQ